MGDQLGKVVVIATTAIGTLASIVQVIDFMRTGKVSTVLISAGILFLAVPICVLAAAYVRSSGTMTWNAVTVTITASSAVAVLGILGLVVVLIKSPDVPTDPLVKATPSAPATPLASPSPAPSPVGTGADPAVACAKAGEQDPVVLRHITSTDGLPGIGETAQVDMAVLQQAATSHTYWLIMEYPPPGNKTIYKAIAGPAAAEVSLSFPMATTTKSTRKLYVVDADQEAASALKENLAHPEHSWDGYRVALPTTSARVGAACTVTRTR